jgi:hypothetical protein
MTGQKGDVEIEKVRRCSGSPTLFPCSLVELMPCFNFNQERKSPRNFVIKSGVLTRVRSHPLMVNRVERAACHNVL